MPKFTELEVPLSKLLLDPNNYRFRDDPDFQIVNEKRYMEEGVQRRSQSRLREESLIELKRSIIANGFLPVERIVTRKYQVAPETYLVLEGNRRIAALKWIAEDHAAGVDIPPEVLETLKHVPILNIEDQAPGVYEGIMGIRHVSGIKEWGGYQRAQLITSLRDTNGFDSQIVAERLGMSVREVNRRYKAYKALEQMSSNDEAGEHVSAKLYPIFHEAVALLIVRKWLGWNDEQSYFENENELTQFYSWITPHKDDDGETVDPKINGHRDVRELQNILSDPEALAVLQDPTKSLSDAVMLAKREQIAKAWKSQVASATSALRNITLHELKEMEPSDIRFLEELREAVATTISYYKKFTV